MEHLLAEKYDLATRRRLLARFREYFDNGYRDPELLYLGGRYAASLGMKDETRRFLEPLAAMLRRDDGVPPAYVPVGLLLQWAAETPQEREEVRDRLVDLVVGDGVFVEAAAYLGAPGSDEATTQPGGAPSQARGQYESGELEDCRAALEATLLRDGDQPDVLRNLITVTGEQQDVEAYERYWRRYVRILLWRMARTDDMAVAWQDLRRFYLRVADATDRELGRTPDEVKTLISRPGFLPRWLEAHAGLVWLESALKSRRTLQTGLSERHLRGGRAGKLGLMRHWFDLFYPEFSGLLDVGDNVALDASLPSGEYESQLYFDPALRLVTRFLQWHQLGFGLTSRTVRAEGSDGEEGEERHELVRDRHAESVVALAGCVARIPLQHYTLHLKKAVADDLARALDGKTLQQAVQEACALPFFQFRLSGFLDEPHDWPGLVGFFGDPDIEDQLSPTLRMFLALAFCQTDRPFEGLKVACRAVPEIPAAEFKEDKQNHGLWQSVLNANISHAINAAEMPEKRPGLKVPRKATPAEGWIALLQHEISRMAEGDHGPAVKQAAVEKIEETYLEQMIVREAVEKSQVLVQEHKFAEARETIENLPDKPDELRELKANLLGQIREAENAYGLQRKIEQAVEKAKKYVERGDFVRAKGAVRALPDSPAEVKELKQRFLDQIAEAEQQRKLRDQIEAALGKAKEYAEAGQFTQARAAVNALPDSPAEIRKLKREFLSQITEAEGQRRLHDLLEDAVAKAKRYAEKGQFAQARRAVNALPDSPAEVRKIKQDLLSQIDRAEKDAQTAKALRAKIDRAVEASKRHVQAGNFSRARQEIRALPDTPSEIKTLKRNLLSQIDDAEREYGDIDSKIYELLDKFMRRNIDLSVIGKIAKDNKVDMNNKAQFYALLQAIDRQLF